MKLLLIDDDKGITRALKETLRAEYEVTIAHTGFTGLQLADDEDFDCVLLDLGLPDISGLRVCELLRTRGCNVPILILSAESQVLNKIKLLDAGADDYLTKPFSLGELKARLRVVERHSQKPKNPAIQLTIDDVSIDGSRREVTRSGQQIDLRGKEYSILECLMQNSGKIVTRSSLGEYAWSQLDSPWANTIDVHIKLLRDKFDRPFDKKLIKTVHGFGYRYEVAGK